VNETTSSKNNAKAKPLPTLFASESKLMLPAEDDNRILASLDGRAADSPSSGPVTSKAKLFLVGLLLSLLGVAGWLYATNAGNVRSRYSAPVTQVGVVTPPTAAPVLASNSAVTPPEPASANASAVAPVAVVAATPEATQASTTATIINEPSSPKVAEKPVQTAAKTARQADPIQELIERNQKAEKSAGGSTIAISAPSKVARNSAAAPPMKMRGGQPFEPSATAVSTSRADSDIDLLAALFAHGEGRPGMRSTPVLASGSVSPTNSNTQRSQPVSVASNSYTEQRPKTNDPARDIVTAFPGASTEELVKRCRTLGWLEGELCRYRICSNQWGKDAACPLNNTASNSGYK
jgi:hypothetical protein